MELESDRLLNGCPICRSPRNSFRRLFHKDKYDFVRCSQCSVIHLEPMPSDHTLSLHYKNRAASGNYNFSVTELRSVAVRYVLKVAVSNLKSVRGLKFLDIGCFDGMLLNFAKDAGFDTWGIEYQEEAAREAEKSHPGRIFQGRLEDFKTEQKFDIISAVGLIEHLQEPLSLFQIASNNLSEGGILLIQTPNQGSWLSRLMGKFWFCYAAPEHTFYFSRSSLKQLAANYGFFEVAYQPHFKTLPIRYVYEQMSYWGKDVRLVFSIFYHLIPRSLRDRSLPFYGGEMIQTFRKI
jgi:SAM-dependent methyltransferase